MAASEREKTEYKKHSEIKTYRPTVREVVRGSARHSSKFSNDAALVRDNQEKFEALVRLSNHVADLETRLTAVEAIVAEGGKAPKK